MVWVRGWIFLRQEVPLFPEKMTVSLFHLAATKSGVEAIAAIAAIAVIAA